MFEFITNSLGSQGTICGGGRYDYLIEEVGGKPAPAVGWALGVERVLELIKEQGVAQPTLLPDAYAVLPEADAMLPASQLLSRLRALGVQVQMHAATASGLGSMKSQFKKADASGARYALVFGASELASGQVLVKSLRDGQGEQVLRSLDAVQEWGPALRA